jgi:hypothetical protein
LRLHPSASLKLSLVHMAVHTDSKSSGVRKTE